MRGRERQTERETEERDKEREAERERQRKRGGETDRETDRDKKREERERQRKREREGDRERERDGYSVVAFQCPVHRTRPSQDAKRERVRHLWSSTQSRLYIPCDDQGNNMKHFGVRAFSNAAPKLWNSVPITLREHNSKETFEKNLKTFLSSEN